MERNIEGLLNFRKTGGNATNDLHGLVLMVAKHSYRNTK